VVWRRMYGRRKAWAVAMGEINKNGDSSNLHAVSRCGEKAWEAGEAGQLGHVPFLLSLAADLFTRGGLCLTPLLGKSLAHYWPIMDPVIVNQVHVDKNMHSHLHMTLSAELLSSTAVEKAVKTRQTGTCTCT
jgi:hypothetical protein